MVEWVRFFKKCMFEVFFYIKEIKMTVQYMVKAFVPKVVGCGAQDSGWNDERCKQFQDFLNQHATGGWRFHSSEYREVTVQGCSGGKGAWLVCTFEKES